MATLLAVAETPGTWASRGQAIEISDEIASFPKLEEALGRDLERLDDARPPSDWAKTRVTGRIGFDFADAQSDDVVAAIELRATVPMVCQRCLGLVDETLDVDLSLELVTDDQSPVRPGNETWELDGDLVRPLDLVDELLVMALPFAAMHDDKDCSAVASHDAPAREETVRPFAELRAQMEAAPRPDEPADD